MITPDAISGYFLTPPESSSCNFLSSAHLLTDANAACFAQVLGFAIRKRAPPVSKIARSCGTVCAANSANVLMPLSLNSSLILGPIPSTIVKSLAFLRPNPAAFAAAISMTIAVLFTFATGLEAAFGLAVDSGAGVTAVGAIAALVGISVILVGDEVSGFVAGIWSVLEQHLHKQRLSNQPIKTPKSSQNQQHDNVLKNALIMNPQ